MRAQCLIRPQPHYRAEAFRAGLDAAGYRLMSAFDPVPGDVLVIWNRYGDGEARAAVFEKRGGTVIVVENGYLGADAEGRQHYALAIGGHNGSGAWRVGGAERWQQLGIALQPWRSEGNHILVRGQRGIGTPQMASPAAWHWTMRDRLRTLTKRPIVVREHPELKPQPPLAEQLAGAHALVVWSSSDAGRALVAGVPVFYLAPHIVCAAACLRELADIENPFMGDRLPAMTALAWAQWSVEEIAAGTPFRHLAQQGAIAA